MVKLRKFTIPICKATIRSSTYHLPPPPYKHDCPYFFLSHYYTSYTITLYRNNDIKIKQHIKKLPLVFFFFFLICSVFRNKYGAIIFKICQYYLPSCFIMALNN